MLVGVPFQTEIINRFIFPFLKSSSVLYTRGILPTVYDYYIIFSFVYTKE